MELEKGPHFDASKRQLPPQVSLQAVDFDGSVIFEATGKWLYPLFELEVFIEEHMIDARNYFLHDRIAGKAAAALTTRLGFKYVKAEMMSSLATNLYQSHHVVYSYTTLVDKILCQTEKLFENIDDVEEIYSVIDERRRDKA